MFELISDRKLTFYFRETNKVTCFFLEKNADPNSFVLTNRL
jgi:hypothetical protein